MRVVLTGGGTGGHIYPALALWKYTASKRKDTDFLYIGTERGLERELVARAKLPFEPILAAGLKRQLSIAALRTAALTFQGYLQAKRLLKRFRPDVVVGTGGYVTLPVVYAAHRLGIPAVIWEANAIPGLTNRLCAKKAESVAVSFSDSGRYFSGAKRVVFTGNPRGSEVLNVASDAVQSANSRYHIRPDRKLIICYAGSRGAETVNKVVTGLLPRFREHPNWQFLYVTGEAHFDKIMSELKDVPNNVEVLPFIYDMPAVLSSAHLVITRAGGATLAEICSLGIASILIPSPYVTANHQEANAHRLSEAGAATLLLERDLTAETLWDAIVASLMPERQTTMREAARGLAAPNAVADLYDVMMAAVDK